MVDQSILWRRLDCPGHEFARAYHQDSLWRLTGTAVFAHERQPCRLDYLIVCDSEWQTVSGRVTGWLSNQSVEVDISVDYARRWRLDGTEQGELRRLRHQLPEFLGSRDGRAELISGRD